MNSTDLESRIAVLRNELREKEAYLGDVKARLGELELEQARKQFSCECVKLNKELGIFDMAQQEQAHRAPLQLGWVHLTLSADRGCTGCQGSGTVAPR